MSLAKIEKQPYESFMAHGSFGDVMETGDTISTYAVTAVDKDDADATSTVIEPSSEIIGTGNDYYKLYFRVRAGTEAASPYKVTVRVETTNGDKWEVDFHLVIKEL